MDIVFNGEFYTVAGLTKLLNRAQEAYDSDQPTVELCLAKNIIAETEISTSLNVVKDFEFVNSDWNTISTANATWLIEITPSELLMDDDGDFYYSDCEVTFKKLNNIGDFPNVDDIPF